MKDIYKRLLFEMMSNSRRSDRDLAKVLGVSQPTVTRARSWLEANGLVREYTLIPNFAKMEFELLAFTFLKIRLTISREKYEEIGGKARVFLKRHPNVVMALRGEGLGFDGVIVSIHENFAEFTKFMREVRTEIVDTEIVGSFLASLEESDQYRSLTFRHIKEYKYKAEKS